MKLEDRIAKHKRMAESYRDKYVLQKVQEGELRRVGLRRRRGLHLTVFRRRPGTRPQGRRDRVGRGGDRRGHRIRRGVP